jgi:predicted nucleic acid-binding protein
MIVLDTNVLSELMRSHPAAPVFAWAATQPRSALYTTSINKAEIFYGIAVLPEGRRRAALAAAAEAMFIDDFAGRVLPFDEEAAVHYAEMSPRAVVKAYQSRLSTRKSPRRPASPAPSLPPAMSEISRAAASPWSIHGKRHNRDDRGPALATDHRLLSGCPEDALGKVSVASEVRRAGTASCRSVAINCAVYRRRTSSSPRSEQLLQPGSIRESPLLAEARDVSRADACSCPNPGDTRRSGSEQPARQRNG